MIDEMIKSLSDDQKELHIKLREKHEQIADKQFEIERLRGEAGEIKYKLRTIANIIGPDYILDEVERAEREATVKA